MTKEKDIKNILVIGSGAIIIGQAAEFDYSGTQAILALKEEGYCVSLINNNPATIMTDNGIADKVHIVPITCEEVEKIIVSDKIDAILATCGGQTALNLALELCAKGIIDKYGVRLLGVNLETLKYSEDRLMFKQKMIEIGIPVCDSIIVSCKDVSKQEVEECLGQAKEFVKKAHFPVIIRPSFTLGGTGGGTATNEQELHYLVENGLKISPVHEVLIEQSIYGWKEIEYEIIRDKDDNCICVCDMENVDPVGIHTGDSVVVAPTQTLTQYQKDMLKNAAKKVVKELKINGACNVQFGLHPQTDEFVIIEVNPRASRSSALASKATAYPIARITAKIAVGKTLHEIVNNLSGLTAAHEPVVKYVVCKVPSFSFSKFKNASNHLGTQMKATGEYMGIGHTFEEAFLKCYDVKKLIENIEKQQSKSTAELLKNIETATDVRFYEIFELLLRGVSSELIAEKTKIHKWFLYQLQHMFYKVKTKWNGKRKIVIKLGKKPCFRAIDGSGEEHIAKTKYVYSTNYSGKKYGTKTNLKPLKKTMKNAGTGKYKGTIVVVGASAIKIGQGIEFDYASVHAVKSLKKQGYRVVIINNNPETISTDYDLADRLYFEPINAQIIKKICKFEKAKGVVIQFGGQTSLNIAKELKKMHIKIFGTSLKSIDASEDRKKFYKFTKKMHIPQPKSVYCKVKSVKEKVKFLHFPVIVRPSYVIGGSKMKVCNNFAELQDYLKSQKPNNKVYVDEFIQGKEAEIDMVADKFGNVFIPLIAEHIEGAGVHSGDSNVLYPQRNLTPAQQQQMIKYATDVAKKLKVVGLMNIQFVVHGDDVYVIEANLRSSRTIPTINKVCGVDLVDLAVQAALGKKISVPHFIIKKAVKKPVFSNNKITTETVPLGVEMKSTGEVLEFE